jgi:hypothetical protein
MDLLLIEWVTKVKLDINSVVDELWFIQQLSHKGHSVDGVLVGPERKDKPQRTNRWFSKYLHLEVPR